MQFTEEQLEKLNKKYDSIGLLYCDRAKVKKGDKFGYINSVGKLVVPLIYDKAFSFANGYAFVSKNGLFGAIDVNGDETVKCEHIYYTEAEIRLDSLLNRKHGEDYIGILSGDDRL